MKKWIEKLISLGLRGLSMGSKFIVIIFITKNYSEYELGQFSLIQSSIILGFFLVGLDFYNYSNRELINNIEEPKKITNILLHQFILYLVSYMIFIPCFILFFNGSLFDSEYTVVFLLLLVAEHIGQEFFRILVVFKKILVANILLFVRAGLWVFVLLGLFYSNLSGLFTLNEIFYVWLTFSSINIIISAYIIFKDASFIGFKLQFDWLLGGLKVSLIFLSISMLSKFIEYGSRYIINYFEDSAQVGIFAFFSSVSNLIPVVVSTVVIIFQYPELVASYNDKKVFNRKFSVFKKEIFLLSIFLGVVLFFLLPFLLDYLNKDSLKNYFSIGIICLIANTLITISFIWHYKLYAARKDSKILLSTGFSFIVFLILSFFLTQQFSVFGSAIALLISSMALVLSKFFYARMV